MDDAHVGAVLRGVRRHHRLRQADVARLAGTSQAAVSRAERGYLGSLHFGTLRSMAGALEIRLELVPSWRGDDLPRLLNARHALLHETLADRLAAFAEWESAAEVSYSVFGERGVLDRLAFHRPTRMLAVFELKADLVDPAALIAQLDRYGRLAPVIGRERGWDGVAVSRWALVAETTTNRRQLAAHRTLLRGALPLDGRALDGWLACPRERVDGLAFLPHPPASTGNRTRGAGKRVRVASRRTEARPKPVETDLAVATTRNALD